MRNKPENFDLSRRKFVKISAGAPLAAKELFTHSPKAVAASIESIASSSLPGPEHFKAAGMALGNFGSRFSFQVTEESCLGTGKGYNSEGFFPPSPSEMLDEPNFIETVLKPNIQDFISLAVKTLKASRELYGNPKHKAAWELARGEFAALQEKYSMVVVELTSHLMWPPRKAYKVGNKVYNEDPTENDESVAKRYQKAIRDIKGPFLRFIFGDDYLSLPPRRIVEGLDKFYDCQHKTYDFAEKQPNIGLRPDGTFMPISEVFARIVSEGNYKVALVQKNKFFEWIKEHPGVIERTLTQKQKESLLKAMQDVLGQDGEGCVSAQRIYGAPPVYGDTDNKPIAELIVRKYPEARDPLGAFLTDVNSRLEEGHPLKGYQAGVIKGNWVAGHKYEALDIDHITHPRVLRFLELQEEYKREVVQLLEKLGDTEIDHTIVPKEQFSSLAQRIRDHGIWHSLHGQLLGNPEMVHFEKDGEGGNYELDTASLHEHPERIVQMLVDKLQAFPGITVKRARDHIEYAYGRPDSNDKHCYAWKSEELETGVAHLRDQLPGFIDGYVKGALQKAFTEYVAQDLLAREIGRLDASAMIQSCQPKPIERTEIKERLKIQGKKPGPPKNAKPQEHRVQSELESQCLPPIPININPPHIVRAMKALTV